MIRFVQLKTNLCLNIKEVKKGSMKKIFILSVALMLLSGCAESIALLGPASTSVTGGNIAQSTFSSAMSYGVKKQTGKSPMEHAMAYACLLYTSPSPRD